MSTLVTHIIRLTTALATFENLSHWRISKRVFGSGDKLQALMGSNDLTTRRAEEAMLKLSQIWPDDLEWPSDIPRPATSEQEEAHRA